MTHFARCFALGTLIGFLGALVGCSDGSDRPDINAGEDTVCAEVAVVACYNMFLCCTEGEIESYLGVDEPRSEEQCRHDVELRCRRDLSAVEWSMDNGRVTLDAARLNECLEALLAPETACAVVDTAAPWVDACAESPWLGTVTDGGECFTGYECATGNYCAADRKCHALPGQDENCSPAGCADGLYCDQGTCQPLGGSGDTCTSSFQCEEGLFCDLDAGAPACAAQKTTGEMCTGNDQCGTATCVPGTCASNGSTCYEDTDCFGECEETGNFCFDSGDCQGRCSIAQTTCFTNTNCPLGETCDQLECIRNCIGDPFCADNYVVYDYCNDALAQLPN